MLHGITEKLHGACSSPGAGFGSELKSLQVTLESLGLACSHGNQ